MSVAFARVPSRRRALVLAVLASTVTSSGCGDQILAVDGGSANGSDASEAARDAGRSLHAAWVDYCEVATTCGFGDIYAFIIPDGGAPGARTAANLMTLCVADQLIATTGPYGPFDPPEAIWLDCVGEPRTTCESFAACANGGNADTSCKDVACQGNVALWCVDMHGVKQVALDCDKFGETRPATTSPPHSELGGHSFRVDAVWTLRVQGSAR